MPIARPTVLLAVLALAAPASAAAQGAGDDQYQDPFGDDQPAQTQPRDDGLSDAPQVPGSGSSTSGGGSSAGSSGSAAQAPSAAASAALPQTGSEPLWLALSGGAFLLIGAGLRLRTIDPDAF